MENLVQPWKYMISDHGNMETWNHGFMVFYGFMDAILSCLTDGCGHRRKAGKWKRGVSFNDDAHVMVIFPFLFFSKGVEGSARQKSKMFFMFFCGFHGLKVYGVSHFFIIRTNFVCFLLCR